MDENANQDQYRVILSTYQHSQDVTLEVFAGKMED